MGRTFVSARRELDALGFWLRDWILELWLRFLALHIEVQKAPDLLPPKFETNGCWLHAATSTGVSRMVWKMRSLQLRVLNWCAMPFMHCWMRCPRVRRSFPHQRSISWGYRMGRFAATSMRGGSSK